jgi:hypothetical protein
MSRANVLHGADEVEEMRPTHARKDDPVGEARAPRRHCRQHQRLGAERREPARVSVKVGELWAADVVVMQYRLGRAGDDSKTVALEHRFGEVAAVREETRRPSFDRPFANGRGLRKHPLGVELMTPSGNIAYTPRRWRQGDARSRRFA